MSIKQINDTTFSADGLGDVKPLVLIGGKTTDKFIPNVNASFYDDEFFINLNRKGKPAVSGKSSAAEIGGNDKDIFHIDDQGRLKWDIEFSECLKSLMLEWEIKCSEGIEFLYQGPLTEEEIKDGCVRPDEIVGSYAVYCDKANNKYKTGKLCHIPRPFVIDANGSREWCAMLITDGVLTITLPELFMQSAVYPVRLDPTFGYTTQGGTWGIVYGGLPRGTLYNTLLASSGDSITQFHIYAKYSYSATTVDMAAYSIASGYLSSRLAAALTLDVDSSDMTLINSAIVSQSLSVGTTYGLAFCPGDGVQVPYDDGTEYSDVPVEEGALPASWTHSSYLNRIWSLYATYDESSGGSGNSYYYMMNQ